MACHPETPTGWLNAVEAIGPASLLVVIEARMGADLKARTTPEDVLQEALLQAWRDRGQIEWRGLRAFRTWLLTIIDHRIRDIAEYHAAQKRGGGQRPRPLAGGGSQDHGNAMFEPIASTTPSRLATYREQAAAISETLRALPDDVQQVVRMRLLEQLPIAEIAARLGIGESAVRHRFRKGAALYRQGLMTILSSHFTALGRTSAAHSQPDSAF